VRRHDDPVLWRAAVLVVKEIEAVLLAVHSEQRAGRQGRWSIRMACAPRAPNGLVLSERARHMRRCERRIFNTKLTPHARKMLSDMSEEGEGPLVAVTRE
jgi:hypothetical protein